MEFYECNLNNVAITSIENLLARLEILHIADTQFSCDSYETVLNLCVNLKEISVMCFCKTDPTDKHNWLLRKYPKMEYLEFIGGKMCQINELNDFFTQNSNVRTFSTNQQVIWANRNIFLNSQINLDVLDVLYENDYIFMELAADACNRSKRNVDLLNKLHEQGFYKRLHLTVHPRNMNVRPLLGLFNGLEALRIGRYYKNFDFDLTQLTNLKELALDVTTRLTFADFENWANSLVRLERLFILRSHFIDAIIPFVRRSPSLKKLKILCAETKDNNVVLNLKKLNEERAKLPGAQKVTIYVRDYIFLKTKWTTENGDMNLKFIEMKRSDSYRWDHYSRF